MNFLTNLRNRFRRSSRTDLIVLTDYHSGLPVALRKRVIDSITGLPAHGGHAERTKIIVFGGREFLVTETFSEITNLFLR
jgi:hypothetical protein